jgi:hypothetical protein
MAVDGSEEDKSMEKSSSFVGERQKCSSFTYGTFDVGVSEEDKYIASSLVFEMNREKWSSPIYYYYLVTGKAHTRRFATFRAAVRFRRGQVK